MRKSWIMSAAGAAAFAAIAAPAPSFAQSRTETATSDAPADATTRASLSTGRAVSGRLDPAGDADWFRIRLRAGQSYSISLAGEGEEGAKLGDPMLRLLDNEGTEVATNDDGPDGLDSLLVHAPERSGAFYVEARGFGDDAAGAYRLSVEARRAPRDDAGGGASTRARLALDGAVEGLVGPGGDKDWYRVDLEAGQSYRFSLVSAGEPALGDPFMRVLDAEGEELASDDDGGDGLNSYIEFTAPAAGRYFVEAASFSDGSEGAYRLSAARGDIPADATTDVTLDANGDYREGVLAPAGDSDWYKLALDAGQTVRVGLASGGANPLGDPYLVVHGPDGAEVAQDDDGGEGLHSWLEYAAATAGVHFVEARAFGEGGEGGYVISLTAGEVGGDAEHAEGLSPGAEGRSSLINPAGDQDWYLVELVEGRTYRFNLQGAGDAKLADPMLRLHDSTGAAVAEDDDGGTGFDSYLSYSPTAGGTYYAAASSFDGTGTGAYVLRVSDTDVPGSDATDEFLDASGDERETSIEMPGDADFFAVDLEAGARYLVTLSGVGDHPLADPFLSVLTGAGAEAASDDDSGPGLDSRLTFTPRETGRYHLKATGLGGSIGRYKIAIARQ